MWDDLIQEHIDNMKKIEQELSNTHQEEVTKFNEEIESIVIPKPKFSKNLINNHVVLQNLIKTKKYSEAQEISDQIEEMVNSTGYLLIKLTNILQERYETDKWNTGYKDKFNKKKQALNAKQKNEMDALRVKLENSLQEKLKMRSAELQK